MTPIRAALSKPALRAYLTTLLVAVSGSFLFVLAVFAYVLFYNSYIPRIGFERAIHLQFDNVFQTSDAQQNALGVAATYPYGVVPLPSDLISGQAYDIMVEMTLPRTPENLNAGNFMLDTSLNGGAKSPELYAPTTENAGTVIARSRRPGILAYRSRIIDLAHRLTQIHWYVLGVRHEIEKVDVKVFDGISFAKGWRNIPTSLRLEIQSVRRMQFYDAKVMFKARFTGLRYFMYNYQLTAAFVFISWFWSTELFFAGAAWTALVMQQNEPGKVKSERLHEIAENVKEEKKDEQAYLSDTDRTFPTLSGQPPLRYRSPDIKEETMPTPIQAIPPAMDADDEDEEAASFVDSGIGTSLESGPGRASNVRKRRSKLDSQM